MQICTLCNKYKAIVDGKTKKDQLALMCMTCYLWHGIGMGDNKGKYIIENIKQKYEEVKNEISTR